MEKQKENEERVITKFLFLPKKIGNEVKWFKKVRIKQKSYYMFDFISDTEWFEWVDKEWV
jgi:hypothetical protein